MHAARKTASKARAAAERRCPCSGLTLDRLVQPAVLTVLAQARLHGYGLGKALAAMRLFRDRQPDLTGLYRALKEMQRRGLIESSAARSEEGPQARLYRLTPAGAACLARWVYSLNDYRHGLGDLLLRARKAARLRKTSGGGRRVGAWEQGKTL